MKIIEEIPRKNIRYFLFRKRDGKNKIGKEEGKIIEYFENSDNFDGWENFSVTWDIGMSEDIVAQANRKEKWFLFNSSKKEIVRRPKNYWEKEAQRLGISTHALFHKESSSLQLSIDEFFRKYLPEAI